jgi:predicted transcriptional regulator
LKYVTGKLIKGMRRSSLEITADLLNAINGNKLAPTRASQTAGVNPARLQQLVKAQLAIVQPSGKKRCVVQITEKGRKYLEHYHTLQQLIQNKP